MIHFLHLMLFKTDWKVFLQLGRAPLIALRMWVYLNDEQENMLTNLISLMSASQTRFHAYQANCGEQSHPAGLFTATRYSS